MFHNVMIIDLIHDADPQKIKFIYQIYLIQ